MNVDIESSLVEQPAEKNKKMSREFIGIIIVLILAVAGIGYSLFLNQNLAVLNQHIAVLQKDVDDAMVEITKRDDQIEWLYDCISGLQLSQFVSGNIVTDDLYIDRAMLTVNNNKISGRVDILAQPAFVLNYKGRGRFDLSDRELSASLLSLMKSFESAIGSYGSAGDIDVTIQNYEVATYSQGKISLIGE